MIEADVGIQKSALEMYKKTIFGVYLEKYLEF